ncbi:hypothetical protein BOTCAL_0044g00180 [Botryotinia calthae]|uniref:Uncharacterized protein n=1 Tax=Botryotinia calthae TaxID=38488 RepID=A0A4Y8DCC3_9HELO|nr:hypothetical protein BOTCAL_0044g00180 [Botryotinia calthae]
MFDPLDNDAINPPPTQPPSQKPIRSHNPLSLFPKHLKEHNLHRSIMKSSKSKNRRELIAEKSAVVNSAGGVAFREDMLVLQSHTPSNLPSGHTQTFDE